MKKYVLGPLPLCIDVNLSYIFDIESEHSNGEESREKCSIELYIGLMFTHIDNKQNEEHMLLPAIFSA